MRRAVIDTSVVVAAFRSRRGGSHAVLQEVGAGRLRPLVSTALFLEYEAVLKRDAQLAAHGLGLDEVEAAIASLAASCEPVDIHYRWRPISVDPADDLVIETAANGGADVILTHNVRHFAGPAARFGIAVLTPGTWLKEVARG